MATQNVKLTEFQYNAFKILSEQLEKLNKDKVIIEEKIQLILALVLDFTNTKINSSNKITVNPQTQSIEIISEE